MTWEVSNYYQILLKIFQILFPSVTQLRSKYYKQFENQNWIAVGKYRREASNFHYINDAYFLVVSVNKIRTDSMETSK